MGKEGTPRWLGRALALLGTAPTESAIANLENDRNVIPFCKPHIKRRTVIWPSCTPPMEALRFLQRRGAARRYVLREMELLD